MTPTSGKRTPAPDPLARRGGAGVQVRGLDLGAQSTCGNVDMSTFRNRVEHRAGPILRSNTRQTRESGLPQPQRGAAVECSTERPRAHQRQGVAPVEGLSMGQPSSHWSNGRLWVALPPPRSLRASPRGDGQGAVAQTVGGIDE